MASLGGLAWMANMKMVARVLLWLEQCDPVHYAVELGARVQDEKVRDEENRVAIQGGYHNQLQLEPFQAPL